MICALNWKGAMEKEVTLSQREMRWSVGLLKADKMMKMIQVCKSENNNYNVSSFLYSSIRTLFFISELLIRTGIVNIESARRREKAIGVPCLPQMVIQSL